MLSKKEARPIVICASDLTQVLSLCYIPTYMCGGAAAGNSGINIYGFWLLQGLMQALVSMLPKESHYLEKN